MSQYDIIGISISLLGMLCIFNGQTYKASLLFGLAITTKTFPAFVFVAVILLCEKNVLKLSLCGLIFLSITKIYILLFKDIPLYVEKVLDFSPLQRIFIAGYDTPIHVSYLMMLYGLICAFCYFYQTKTEDDRRKSICYVWLLTSCLPFLFIWWHPQWIYFIVPPMVVTTALIFTKVNLYKIMLLDIAGFVFFVAASANIFPNNVDLNMFQADMIFSNYHYDPNHSLRSFFSKFSLGGDFYLSFFNSYILAHLGMKYYLMFADPLSKRFMGGSDISLKIYPYLFFVVAMAIYLVACISRMKYGFS